MIDKITYTKEHLLSLVKKYKTDPQLLERAKDDISFIEILDKSNLPIERKNYCLLLNQLIYGKERNNVFNYLKANSLNNI